MRQGRFTLCSKQGTGVLEEELRAGSPEWGVLWLMGGYSSQCLTRISGLGEACKDSFFFKECLLLRKWGNILFCLPIAQLLKNPTMIQMVYSLLNVYNACTMHPCSCVHQWFLSLFFNH